MTMPLLSRRSLTEACYEAAGIDRQDESAEADRQRQGVDLQTRLSLEYLANNHKATRGGMRRYVKFNTRKAKEQAEDSDKPQFGFLMIIFGWLLSWAFGKVLDTVWSWYQGTEGAPSLAAGMLQNVERLGTAVPDSWQEEAE
jgi:hypothetical protein